MGLLNENAVELLYDSRCYGGWPRAMRLPFVLHCTG